MDGLQWKTLFKWMIWGENPIFFGNIQMVGWVVWVYGDFWTHPNHDVRHSPKRRQAQLPELRVLHLGVWGTERHRLDMDGCAL